MGADGVGAVREALWFGGDVGGLVAAGYRFSDKNFAATDEARSNWSS